MLARAPWLLAALVACAPPALPPAAPAVPAPPAPSAPPAPAPAPPPPAPVAFAPVGAPLAPAASPPLGPPPADPAVQLVSASQTVCAVLASGAVSCWGGAAAAGPSHRLVGIHDAIGVALLTSQICVLHRGGSVGCGALGRAPLLAPIRGAHDAVEIAANGDALCVRERAGGAACWVEGGPRVFAPVAGLTGAQRLVMGTLGGPEWQFPLVSFGCTLGERGDVACFEVYRQAILDPRDPRQPYDAYLAHRGVPPALHVGKPYRLPGIAAARELIAPDGQARVCTRGERGDFACSAAAEAAPGSPPPAAEPQAATAAITHWAGACKARGELVHCEQSFAPPRTVHLAGVTALVDASDHACAIAGGGRVLCWGAAESGGLGAAPALTGAGEVLGLTDAIDLATWGYGALAVRANGQLAYWGHGPDGFEQADRPMTFSALTDAVRVSGDLGGACALRRGGKVSCWGNAFRGQAGEIAGFAGAHAVRVTTEGAIATLADGHVVHLGDDLLGPSHSETPAPLPGAEHAVDALVVDRWVCARDRTPGPVRCHAETHDWVAPTLVLDVPDVVEMVGAPPRTTVSAPRALGSTDKRDADLPYPSAFLALRRASGEVVQVHLTLDRGVPRAEVTPFVPQARALVAVSLARCAVTDAGLACHSDEHDQWNPAALPPEAADATAFALGNPTCALRPSGRVTCVGLDPITAGRGIGVSAVPVPIDL